MKTSKKVDKTKIREKSKDDIPSKKKDEPLKKSVYSVSTPRNFVQKSTTADIYVKKNAVTNAHKKTLNASQPSKASPMKDVLKSTPNVPISARSKTSRTDSNQKPLSTVQKSKSKTNKAISINVTVNSPIVKRKLKLEESTDTNDIKIKTKEANDRQRTNTRTLHDDEVKILTPDVVDNNAEMANLSKKLTAKSKAFYVNLNGQTEVDKNPSSEEEMSYEDDFESYESDFESYKSSQSESPRESSEEAVSGGEAENSKEERMLDSGHFDMRETKSANKAKLMDFIVETTEEDDKKTSLTDEGFQEMSSSSGAPSMKTVHVDVLERPLFIDFSKSKENRRKRRIIERLKQRATDILSMVSLHEMSYSLFEMKPIPYELFMATFGRENYTQTAVQTFDDGITTEVQTEEVLCDNKWTQHPIEFTKNDVCLNFNKNVLVKNENIDLNYLFNDEKPEMELDDDYKNNNLRIYLEQKDGVGSDKIMSQETYKTSLKRKDFDMNKLGKFLKKVESRICSILSVNVGSTDLSNLIKTSKYPFSNGYLPMSTKKLTDEKYSYLKNSDIIGVVFSKTKSNLIFTIHQKVDTGVTAHKCVLCLWDLSVVIFEPIKVLIATDNVTIGIFYGSTDGFFIGAIDDGSIHLWDLSEEPSWCNEDEEPQAQDLQLLDSRNLTPTGRDREWNFKNRDDGVSQEKNMGKFQTSAFTTSAFNMSQNDGVDCIVALEFLQESRSNTDMSNQKIIGQVSALQRSGILTIWSVLQEKFKKYTHDLGKAYCSRLKLQKTQTVILTDHIFEKITIDNIFNLNSAKRRLATKRLERSSIKFECTRPNSSYKTDRPMSAASVTNSKISVENFANVFDNPIICNDLKIMIHNKCVYYLVAKNCGEILCCARIVSAVKVKSLTVADPASTITSLSVSPHGFHYFLAATDSGTINMCSFDNFRVLLTLDCSHVPPTTEKYISDHKGRFVGSSEIKQEMWDTMSTIKSVVWSPADPFCVVALMMDGTVHVWELTHSDIHAKSVCARAASACVASDKALAIITPENEVQVHKLLEKTERLEFFQKYVAHL